MAQGSDVSGFRARDSTLRANVSKASRRSPSPMLESVPATAPMSGARRRAGRGSEGRRRLGEAVHRLGELDAPDRAGPERRVDPLAQQRHQHLQLRRMRAADRDRQEAAGRPAGAGEPDRRADRGELGAGDLRPERPQPRLGEALARAAAVRICALDQAAGADEAAAAFAAALPFGRALPLSSPMRAAAPASATRLTAPRAACQGERIGATAAADDLLAWYDRVGAACCPGARRRAPAGPTPMRSGSPR